MNILKSLTRAVFKSRFGTIESYMEYLSEEKWQTGYQYRKCQDIHYCKVKKLYNSRCTMCSYNESTTSYPRPIY